MPDKSGNLSSANMSQPQDWKLIVEKDVPIKLRDGAGSQMYGHYHADYNLGAENTIYSGGDKPSYLLLPVIPAK